MSEGRKNLKLDIARIVLFICLVSATIIGVWQNSNVDKTVLVKEDGDFFVKELETKEIDKMQDDPIEREVCWNSELPKFISEDLEYCKEKDLEMQYIFGKVNILFNYEEENWYMKLYSSSEDYFINDDEYYNFSIYKDGEGNIAIYAYEDWSFVKITVSKDDINYDVLTYDFNVPFSVKGSRYLGEYSIAEVDGKFSFYKDGEVISTYKLANEELEYVNFYDGYVYTKNKNLYMLYAKIENDIPVLIFSYLGKLEIEPIKESNSDYQIWTPLENDFGKMFSIPVFTKENKFYTILSEDWESFAKYALSSIDYSLVENNETINTNISLINLEDYLKEITFRMSDNYIWEANFVFELNGLKFQEEDYINGYDDSIEFPREVAKEFEKTVTSLDEYWENVEAIRLKYFDYYDHKGD